MDDAIATAADGERLIGFEVRAEPEIDHADDAPLTGSSVIVQRDDAVLLVLDRSRESWSKESWRLPGGGRAPGETPRQTGARGFAEGTGSDAHALVLAGVARYVLPPDDRHERRAVYRTILDQDPVPGFEPDDEVAAIRWWRPSPRQEAFDGLDLLDAALVRHLLGRSEWETTIAAYQRLADRYAERTVPTSPEIRAPFLDRVAALLPQGRLLELGSGPGWDARYLATKGLKVQASDATPAFVEMMRTDGLDAQLIDVRGDDLGGPWDGVLANAVLLHLTRQEFATAVGRVRDAVRAGGIFAFTVKEGDGEAWNHAKLDLPRWFVYWRESALRTVLAEQGWQVIDLDHRPGRNDDWIQVIARPRPR